MRHLAVLAQGDDPRESYIRAAAKVIDDLERAGWLVDEEALAWRQAWVRDFVRAVLPELYRQKNWWTVGRFGEFLKTG